MHHFFMHPVDDLCCLYWCLDFRDDHRVLHNSNAFDLKHSIVDQFWLFNFTSKSASIFPESNSSWNKEHQRWVVFSFLFVFWFCFCCSVCLSGFSFWLFDLLFRFVSLFLQLSWDDNLVLPVCLLCWFCFLKFLLFFFSNFSSLFAFFTLKFFICCFLISRITSNWAWTETSCCPFANPAVRSSSNRTRPWAWFSGF